MIGSILRGSLIGNARAALYWGLALAFFGFYAVALTPDTSGSATIRRFARFLRR